MTDILRRYFAFVSQCYRLMAGHRMLFAVFVGVSLLAALTEGMGITLLVPILETDSATGGFANIPLLGHVSSLFAGFSPGDRIKAVAVVLGVVLILRNLLQYCVDLLGNTVPLHLEQKINRDNFESLLAVEIAYIHQSDFGALQNGLGGWSNRVSMMLTSLAQILCSLMTVAVYIVLMLSVSWRLTMAAVAFMLTVSLLLRWITTDLLEKAGEQLSDAESRLNQTVMESLSGMKLVRLSTAEPLVLRNYASALNRMLDSKRKATRLQALSSPLLSTCAGLFICLLLYVNVVIHGDAPTTWIGSVLLFLFLLFRLMGPVSTINGARNRLLQHMSAFDLLNEFGRDMQDHAQRQGDIVAPPLRRLIAFDRVSFTYKADEKPVIADLSINIERGQMVAVVGPSGAGKTTLLALLARLYDPQQGRILIDGVDLRELNLTSWRKRMAVVSQDTFIFNDTVANNIGFGRERVSEAEIRAAADLASASEFIDLLPEKYDTYLGDRGVRLSGGQQQRIAIARAILANPDLLVFDEATSNLDTFTERAIQTAMERLSKDRTVLVVAHRLSTIRNADRVIVLDQGRVVEQGRHSELIARRGIYWEMVEHQRLDLVGEDAPDAALEAQA